MSKILQIQPDGNTVLLDHFNGTVKGTGFGALTYGESLPNLEQAVNLTRGAYIKYAFSPWYRWDGVHKWDRNEAASGVLTEGTIEMWIKPRQYSLTLLHFNWYDTPSPPSAGTIMLFGLNTDGKLTYGGWGGNMDKAPVGKTTIPLNKWTHVVVSWGPAGTKLYVNGEVDASTTANVWPAFSGTIFAYLNDWGRGDIGLVDELHISKVARTDEEIRSHAAIQHMGVVIFDDQFNDQTLSPSWVISPGKGSYSLTPGYLRYIIDANHTARVAGSGQNYAKSLWLVRPFSGDRWILKTAITYNLRPAAPTNNRNMHFIIRAPGDNGAALVRIDRSVGVNDSNPGSNSMSLPAGSDIETIFFPNSPNPLSADRWYFEIERNKDYVAIRASTGGDDSTFEYVREYTFPPGSFGIEQEIEIEGDGWYGSNEPPGYVDFDFIKVVGNPQNGLEDLPIRDIEGVGDSYAERLDKQGVKTIKDMALANVFSLYKKVGIPLFKLYVIKRRATLALDIKIKGKLFGSILQMQLGDIIALPDEELGRKANQPIEIISDLKKDISTLLVSLDNAVVKAMTLESVAFSDC
ncbi:MAG: LamG-like jellyroll fold domain-containing protein [Candidatus Methanoperedens sp.]